MKNELMKLVTKLEQKISSKYPITLLMLVEREGYSNFRLLISSDTLKSNLSTISMVSKELAKMLTNEEFKLFSGVEIVDPRCDFFIETRDYLENNGNPNEFYNIELGGLKINRALVIISPVEQSRKYVRQAELKQVLMQFTHLLAREDVFEPLKLGRLTGKEELSTKRFENLLFESKKASQRKTIFKEESING
jgi:hypothetical protein